MMDRLPVLEIGLIGTSARAQGTHWLVDRRHESKSDDKSALQSAHPSLWPRRPVSAARALSVFPSPESLNSVGIERATPSFDSAFEELSMDGVGRSIPGLTGLLAHGAARYD